MLTRHAQACGLQWGTITCWSFITSPTQTSSISFGLELNSQVSIHDAPNSTVVQWAWPVHFESNHEFILPALAINNCSTMKMSAAVATRWKGLQRSIPCPTSNVSSSLEDAWQILSMAEAVPTEATNQQPALFPTTSHPHRLLNALHRDPLIVKITPWFW